MTEAAHDDILEPLDKNVDVLNHRFLQISPEVLLGLKELREGILDHSAGKIDCGLDGDALMKYKQRDHALELTSFLESPSAGSRFRLKAQTNQLFR